MNSVRQDLDTARHLVKLGVPLFLAGLADDGSPVCPHGWQHTAPGDLTPADSWQPCMALCAVMGHAYDVLDIDPRNGGDESARHLHNELAGTSPRIYGSTRTPSGGWHYWMAPLGIGSKTNFRPGLDLKGGKPEGTGRGFVFLPPTVRPSKIDSVPRPYQWVKAPTEAPTAGDDSGRELAALVLRHDEREQVVRERPTGTSAVNGATGYVRAALVAELEAVAEAPEGSRNMQLNRSAFALARFVADGVLDGQAVADALTDAAEAAGLGYAESVSTIRSAFAARGAAA